MTQNIQVASTSAVYPTVDADGAVPDYTHESPGGTNLFQRQLSAAGLADVAEKIAASAALDVEDAARLSRATLPLLGRIVQLRPLPVGWTSESVPENRTDPEVHPTTDGTELPVERVAQATDLPRQIAQPLTEWPTYCCQLIALREELGASSEPIAWYPKVNRTPDENASSDDNYTGVEVLRAIALARLLLPENVQIVAPLAALGPKLAQVALDFGATHLGYVECGKRESPIFADTKIGTVPENPLAVDAEELKELQRSCSPTAMKEDS